MSDVNNDKMKTMVGKIASDSTDGRTTKGEDGKVEFNFNVPIPKTGLVFVETDDAEAPDENQGKVTAQPSAEKTPENDLPFSVFDIADIAGISLGHDASISTADDLKDSSGADGDEFIIPDVFEIAESAEETNPADPYVQTIWRPYMPRFTEVTDERRKAKAVSDAMPKTETIEITKVEGRSIKVEKINSASAIFNESDPTAEIVTHIPDAVVVKIQGNPLSSKDSLNVFKFSDEKIISEASADVNPEEVERREISGLTGHSWEEKATTDPIAEEPAKPIVTSETEKKSYESEVYDYEYREEERDESFVIPDIKPEIREVHPEGYTGKDKKSDASDTSEYNSFSMRESFKDRFLDSIMAVRIRLIVAAILSIATFAFDLFKESVCGYFGITDNFGAPAIIDACLVASLFLITLPETARAIKQLVFGVVSPELSSALAGVVIFGYTVAMAILSPVGGTYPLLASIYAIMALNSIFATHCLHSAHFSAFKVISDKGNKSIIDKPFTRTLELENIALDGVVDEYKSRCARIFDTNFVSGFYANSRKNSEKTRNNLIILAISFGIALVGGTVMLFIKGIVSPVSALSTFALVVALSIPAFSILSHKLPFSDAEKEASKFGGAIIGECSLTDYSGVDVITFEDTEVFGPDDVWVKSASDRRSDYLDSMRKMSSLFAALGGPLSHVFESTLNKKYSPAKDVIIEDDGAEGTVDSERVMAGTAEYMRRHGIRIPAGNDIKSGSTRVIYAAADGEFFATFTVHYSFSEEFALLLSAMREEKIVPLVYTRDFNINNDFMRMLTGGSDVIRVMKKYTPIKDKPVYGKINSSLVTRGDKTSAIELILTAKRYARFQSFLSVTEISACSAGAVLAMLIALGNMTATLPTAILAVWQLGWTVALAIMSRKNFRTHEKGNKNAEE